MSEALIVAENLRYTYPDGFPALRGVDFELNRNETVILLGPNGSGKTTFLLHLNGLLLGEGRLRVCGLEVTADNLPVIRHRVGFVFQHPDDQLFLPSVLEDVAFGPVQRGMSADEAEKVAWEALSKTGLTYAAHRAPHHLSAGEKRRAALAGVLALAPEILVLDEPTTFLDPPGQRDLLKLLQSLPQAKVVVTHDAAFARALGARAVFFDAGRIVDAGGVEEIVRRHDWEVYRAGT